MGKLDGKVAVITGGNSGIGLATAQRLVGEGAYVFITGRRQSELDAAVKQIGKNVTAVQGDVSNLADLDRLYATVRKEKGRLDIVFANAATGEFAPLGSITEQHYDKTFDTNVKGLLFTVQKALPLLNVVSPGTVPSPGYKNSLGLTDEQIKQFSAGAVGSTPLGRVGELDEVAKAVVFLASDDSSYVNAIELFVDGGQAQI